MKDSQYLLDIDSLNYQIPMDVFENQNLILERMHKDFVFSGHFLHFDCNAQTQTDETSLHIETYTYNTLVESSIAEYFIIPREALKTLLLNERLTILNMIQLRDVSNSIQDFDFRQQMTKSYLRYQTAILNHFEQKEKKY